ncbi:metallophosphoesterase [Streptomyces sp. WMMB 322]|uniref:metallophosphoesterase family protein n=1 Tax=Streptomyces sp. WMMB 322 TaxID=1286821 RepID=UPI0008238A1F|nr:metallophosphoesterase [Streptomyces sp. WMMB 322]SCK38917.1 Predicted phosphohydrolase, MPP superfamily [Streptomyces sp. WMMB 322]
MGRDARKPRKPPALPQWIRKTSVTDLASALRNRLPSRRTRRDAPGGRSAHGAGAASPEAFGLGPAPRPYVRALGLAATTLVGAWLGLLVVGGIEAPVGPMDTKMALRPSLTGGTEVNVSPLGALELRSHAAPLRLDVDVDQLDQERASALVDHPERLEGLESEITSDVQAGTGDLALRSAVAVVVGAGVLGLAVYRRPGRALVASGLALALLGASGTAAYATWNPKSVFEPKFSGLLAGAPSVVGNARSIVADFDIYQRELARLVTNVTKLYEATSTLPAYQPDPSTTRLLHVSDIHLNPAAWQIIKSLVEQYEIDAIIDTGDTMDHGTSAENGFLEPVTDLGAPYVWVRGNHDSDETQKAFEKLGKKKGSSVHVLDDGVPTNVAGLRLAGWGDPQFTPDRSIKPQGDPRERKEGRRLALALRAQKAADTPVDIAVAHNPVLVKEADGLVPLALAGHTHQRAHERLPRKTRLMIEGSTGGGGLRAVEKEEPQKVSASVLYLGRDDGRLQAWDEITLGGLGLTTAEVTRHLADDKAPSTRSPSPSPSPGSGSPGSGSPSPESGSPGPRAAFSSPGPTPPASPADSP